MCVSAYTTGSTLLSYGLTAQQAIGALIVGALFTGLLSISCGWMGERYGSESLDELGSCDTDVKAPHRVYRCLSIHLGHEVNANVKQLVVSATDACYRGAYFPILIRSFT